MRVVSFGETRALERIDQAVDVRADAGSRRLPSSTRPYLLLLQRKLTRLATSREKSVAKVAMVFYVCSLCRRPEGEDRVVWFRRRHPARRPPRSIDRSGERGAGREEGFTNKSLPASRLHPFDKSRFTTEDGSNWKPFSALWKLADASRTRPGRADDATLESWGGLRTKGDAALRRNARVGPKGGRPENGVAKA